MKTSHDAYREELLLAMRMRDVPGYRIAEALAEIDSHLADSGEDPVEAFGPAKAYAAQVAAGLHRDGRSGWTRALGGSIVPIAMTSGLGGWLLAEGLIRLAAGDRGILGMPVLITMLTGAVLLVGVAAYLFSPARRRAEKVTDPRTGRDLIGPMPRWATAVLVALPVGLLTAAVVAAALTR